MHQLKCSTRQLSSISCKRHRHIPSVCKSGGPAATRRQIFGTAALIASAACMSSYPAMASASTAADTASVQFETDRHGLQRVKYSKSGWNFWDWQGHRVHYIKEGTEGPPVLLIHGYGASAYHWRYNIPALAAQGFRVYALDLLGFGWSQKVITDYSNGKVWTAQISDFIEQVIARDYNDKKTPVVLAGNSLGGYASMATAAQYPDLVRGLVLVNSAGPFEDPLKPQPAQNALDPWYRAAVDYMMGLGKRAALYLAFIRAKQPEQIKSVLKMVYACEDNIDAELVESIVVPATDPKAPEVFYRINSNKGPSLTVNTLLAKLAAVKMPMLLLWGDLDPWITPKRAAQIMALYPSAEKVGLQAGHCPHDDTPAEANKALLKWLQKLPAKTSVLVT